MATLLTPGTVVDRRYRVLGHLGTGGMGTVYAARHEGLQHEVALKIVEPESDISARRFEREGRAAARLDHPGCVRVFDHGKTGRYHYLAMERLFGPSLADELGRSGPLTVGESVDIGTQLLDALSHAHAKGVLHRDIKPGNVVMAWHKGRRRAVLIDFGLARIHDEAPLTAAGLCAGSPSYVAPERLLGRRYDTRADLYSVGVVLYELLTGRRPFVGETPLQIARQHVNESPPVNVRSWQPAIPRALATVVMRAISREPAARFADAAAMLAALTCLRVPEAPRMAPIMRSSPPQEASMTMVIRALTPRRGLARRIRRMWWRLTGRSDSACPTMDMDVRDRYSAPRLDSSPRR